MNGGWTPLPSLLHQYRDPASLVYGTRGGNPDSDGLKTYDGEHPTARFNVSTGVKIEDFMRKKIRNNVKGII